MIKDLSEEPSPWSRLLTWCRLLRIPNLLTAPGDPMAGYVVAAGQLTLAPSFFGAALAGICFYGGGVVVNDLVDIERDRSQRRPRPLVAGLIARGKALTLALTLLLAGLLACWLGGTRTLTLGLLLTLALMAYNVKGKAIPVVGPVNMGLCRALNFGLGVAAAGGALHPVVLIGASFLLAYVASITHIARRETEAGPMGLVRWLPPCVSLVGFGALSLFMTPGGVMTWIAFAGAWLLGSVVAIFAAIQLAGDAVERPALIGILIGALILYQSALIVGYGEYGLALILLLCWPLFRLLSRTFYVS